MRWLWIAALVGLALPARADAQRDPGWDLKVAERVDVAIGGSAQLSIAIAVDRGLAVSKDAAVIVDLAPEAGVTIKKRRLGRVDAIDPEADAPRFAAAVRGDAAGEHAVTIHVKFWLCGTRSCRPVEARRTAQVVVAADVPVDAGHRAP